ncbi:hypothetical protein PoB_002993100 [Plakobranchus ocellatus]|uniref:Uncharacterized protein n=1 Tax=Plakobranchus ocellatus TaxID=259542 RepID=A0AAV4A592_9GAST|nr:hypothetical protein PoB_002993100 [Plakobranchus ocellatus]
MFNRQRNGCQGRNVRATGDVLVFPLGAWAGEIANKCYQSFKSNKLEFESQEQEEGQEEERPELSPIMKEGRIEKHKAIERWYRKRQLELKQIGTASTPIDMEESKKQFQETWTYE